MPTKKENRRQVMLYFSGNDSDKVYAFFKRRSKGHPKEYIFGLIRKDMERKGVHIDDGTVSD